MSVDRGLDREDVVHVHDGMLVIKKHEIMSFAATWMDLELILLSEVIQKKKDTNELTSKTDRYSET